jgi:hypothetical protein
VNGINKVELLPKNILLLESSPVCLSLYILLAISLQITTTTIIIIVLQHSETLDGRVFL